MDPQFIFFILVGFIAQIVDGALGMAYGTLSTSILLALGLPPATVSVSVHTAQVFTTGFSGLFNTFFKNVKWKLCLILSVAGIAGGVGGAHILANIDGHALRPWIAGYLFILGLTIIYKVFRAKNDRKPVWRRFPFFVPALGAAGGFLDSIGGGGWGPIVTSHLLAGREDAPRFVIGSANVAEFFVKSSIAVTLVTLIGFNFEKIVMGLLIGGVIGAPLGAYILRFIKPEKLMVLVGILICGLSLWQAGQIVF